MMSRTVNIVASAVLAGAAAAALADGTVDLEIRGHDKVSSTLRPADEQESFLCDLPRDTVISASVKPRKAPAPPALQLLFQKDGVDVPGAVIAPKGAALVLQPFTVTQSGQYRVVVAGDGLRDGDYDLKVSWTSRAKWSGEGGPLDAAATGQFDFAAPAGALASIAITPAKGSPVVPQVTGLTGPDGDIALGGGSGSATLTLLTTGDYGVRFTNAGGPGNWRASVKLKIAKPVKGKIDLRDGSLGGAFAGDHTVFGRVLGEEGGLVDLAGLPQGPLTGSSISVPAGSLGGPTVITIANGDTFDPGNLNSAGPPVEIGPSGTEFDPSGSDPSKQATVTIPFDPTFFPGGDTTSLVIYVRDAQGNVTEVPRPYLIGVDTVTFSTAHLSTFLAATSNPRSFAGDFFALEIASGLTSNFGGEFGFGLHQASSDGTTVSIQDSGDLVTWQDFGTGGAFSSISPSSGSLIGDVDTSSDRAIVITDSQGQTGEVIDLIRGHGNDVFVGVLDPVVVFRKAAAAPTLASIAGRWHAFHMSFGTRDQQLTPPQFLFQIDGASGSLTIGADGRVTFGAFRGVELDSGFPTGRWTSSPGGEPDEQLIVEISGDVVLLRPPPPIDESPLVLQPVLGGNVLVGRMTEFGGSFSDSSVELLILVRASSGLAKSALAGDYTLVESRFETLDAQGAGGVQDFEFAHANIFLSVAASGQGVVTGLEEEFAHDASGNPVGGTDTAIGPENVRFSLRPDGSFTDDAGGSGAITSDGAFFVRTQFDGGGFAVTFGIPSDPPGR